MGGPTGLISDVDQQHLHHRPIDFPHRPLAGGGDCSPPPTRVGEVEGGPYHFASPLMLGIAPMPLAFGGVGPPLIGTAPQPASSPAAPPPELEGSRWDSCMEVDPFGVPVAVVMIPADLFILAPASPAPRRTPGLMPRPCCMGNWGEGPHPAGSNAFRRLGLRPHQPCLGAPGPKDSGGHHSRESPPGPASRMAHRHVFGPGSSSWFPLGGPGGRVWRWTGRRQPAIPLGCLLLFGGGLSLGGCDVLSTGLRE